MVNFIGICDDDLKCVENLQAILQIILKEADMEWKIKTYTSGTDLLKDINNLRIVFLDIEMPDLDGIETGKYIIQKNPDCKVIIASGIIERFKEAFHINALRFVTKPFQIEELREALQTALGYMYDDEIALYYNRVSYAIKVKQIGVIRAINGYTEYLVSGKWYRKDITLEEAYKYVNPDFFTRISRNEIVNLSKISSYKNDLIRLEDYQTKASRRMKKIFEKRLVDFDLKYN